MNESEGLDISGDRSDAEKKALQKSDHLLKNLGATRIRDLSAVGLLSIGAVFYYGSQNVSAYVQGQIKGSPILESLSKRVDKLEYDGDAQKETNKDIEKRLRDAEAALRKR